MDEVLVWGTAASLVFTTVIKALDYRLSAIPHEPYKGPFNYYWVLPHPTLWTRLSAWASYCVHQVAHWAMIYYAQTYVKTTSTTLHPVNYVALALNGLFAVLHLFQTHTFYDGLAQDTPEITALGEVALMLIWVLLMENNTRGMVAGKPLPLSTSLIRFARKYHGYYFSWAIIYDFWYHPMEGTLGHLWGFFYNFMLMLQSSLFLTRSHLNKWWRLLLELMVAPHGVFVAINQEGNI